MKAGEPYYFTDREHYMYEPMLKNLPWHVGIKARELSVFKLAPVSFCLIIIVYLFTVALIAFVLAVVKYQRDKTVWKIFEYRIKTTEAMAHDLKTPLSAIMAYAENIESSADDPDKTREYSRHISDRVHSMNDMIEGILAYSKSEAGNQSVSKEDVDVVELVKQSCAEFPYMLTDINGTGVILETDKRLLKQTIDNLLSNCDRYGDEESVVDITIDPKKLVITNKTDKTYDDVNSLKKPFVKGEDSRGAKGTGLGLSIAENNLNILGYKLELVSEEGTFKAIIHLG
jgi:signal transduction histidine kinase